ncbi:MAG: phytase [Lewinellaceae bacterium]|nr:phytase [Lewinellaceae bacterium]
MSAGENRYLGSFKITDFETVDGVEETDGIDVVSVPLGKTFPKGLFVAQDGFNYDQGKLQRQNFKMLRWEKIGALFGKNGEKECHIARAKKQ